MNADKSIISLLGALLHAKYNVVTFRWHAQEKDTKYIYISDFTLGLS